MPSVAVPGGHRLPPFGIGWFRGMLLALGCTAMPQRLLEANLVASKRVGAHARGARAAPPYGRDPSRIACVLVSCLARGYAGATPVCRLERSGAVPAHVRLVSIRCATRATCSGSGCVSGDGFGSDKGRPTGGVLAQGPDAAARDPCHAAATLLFIASGRPHGPHAGRGTAVSLQDRSNTRCSHAVGRRRGACKLCAGQRRRV